MTVSIPPPTERVVPKDYLQEPWYRSLDDIARAINDLTTTVDDFIAAPVLPSYTVVTLPAATTAGQLIFVSDESGGAVIAFSDGINWRRVTDRAIVT